MFLVRRPNNASFSHSSSPATMYERPYARLYRLHDDIDSIFDGMMQNMFGRWNNNETAMQNIVPAVEVSSTDEAYCMTIELPGISPENVKLEAKDNTLVLSGEKKAESTEENDQRKYHVQERSYGSFERTFTLPEDADAAQISASHKDGVLSIRIPRKQPEAPKTRAIEIVAG